MRTNMEIKKKNLKNIYLLIISIILALVIGEAVIRFYFMISEKDAPYPTESLNSLYSWIDRHWLDYYNWLDIQEGYIKAYMKNDMSLIPRGYPTNDYVNLYLINKGYRIDEYDKLLGWKLKPNLSFEDISSNSKGIRGKTEYNYARNEKKEYYLLEIHLHLVKV